MKAARYFSALILTLVICAGISGASSAAVVTLDAAAKSAQSDVQTLNPLGVRVQDGQAGIFIESVLLTPQSFIFKVNGLTEPSYDVYVNKAYVGEKSSKDLAQGIQLSIPGTVGDPAAKRCMQALKDKVRAELEHQRKNVDPEARRAAYTLGQAAEWVSMGIMQEKTYRSLDVIIAPAGRSLKPMAWRTRSNAEDATTIITRACWLLQQARDRMYRAIKNPEIRNDTVVAMTPIDFTAAYNTAKKDKPHAEIRVVNNCNLPISGVVSFSLPKGWKSNAKGLSFADLKSGKTFIVSFDLISPAKGAVAPVEFPVSANVKVTEDIWTAKMTLKAIATTRKAPAQEPKPQVITPAVRPAPIENLK